MCDIYIHNTISVNPNLDSTFLSLAQRAGIVAACPGGQIVYSTCTLSNTQNLRVVEQAVHLAQENHAIKVEVSWTQLSSALLL